MNLGMASFKTYESCLVFFFKLALISHILLEILLKFWYLAYSMDQIGLINYMANVIQVLRILGSNI